MRLLRALSLGYTVVLISALAASLAGILFYLRRIGDTLADIGSVLGRVRDETAPLGGHLEPLPGVAAGLADQMAEVRASLVRADQRLADIAESRRAGR